MNDTKPQRQIISRQAAHAAGLLRFYTGVPCKRGHTAERYVSTGGCIMCLSQGFKFRRNAFSHELAAYMPQRLWAPRSYSADELQALEVYLQRCIYEHAKHTGKLTEDLDEALRMQLERMVPA